MPGPSCTLRGQRRQQTGRQKLGRYRKVSFARSSSRKLPVRNRPNSRHWPKALLNAYRVLLTQTRQGLIVLVPHGDAQDPTRPPAFYDETYAFLVSCGVPELK